MTTKFSRTIKLGFVQTKSPLITLNGEKVTGELADRILADEREETWEEAFTQKFQAALRMPR